MQQTQRDKRMQRDALCEMAKAAPSSRRTEIAAAAERMLRDPSGFVRSDAIKAPRQWAGPENVTAIMGVVDDESFVVRHEAIKTLGRFPEQRCAEAVVRVYEQNSTISGRRRGRPRLP